MAKRKKSLAGKYIFRRFVLFLIFAGTLGAGGFFAYTNFFRDKLADTPAMVSHEVSASASPEAPEDDETEPEPDSEASSSFEAEPEPEPELESKGAASAGDWELLLVNYANLLPEGYVPELTAVTESFRVDSRIADSVIRMINDAKLSGITLTICSAYRSVDKQTSLFEAKKQEHISTGKTEQEAIAVAATIVARPGTSEHHTGLALDIVTPLYQELNSGFENTPAFKWLDENAHKYGFVLRFPKDKQDITKIIYEPWHYRYVGEYNAAVMKEKGLCLEEYTAELRAKANDFSDEQSDGESEVGNEIEDGQEPENDADDENISPAAG